MNPEQSSRHSVGTQRRFVALFAFLLLYAATPANARITRIVISKAQSPVFDGALFGATGRYEKLVGRAFGEIDPKDRRHRVIADIDLAPRNARGMVEYSMDIFLLKPLDLSKGNHRILFDVNNRGNNRALNGLNDSSGDANNPTTATDAGNGFLMRQGYTIAGVGWDTNVAPGDNRMTITVPVAKNPDGSSIAGPALEEFAIDDNSPMAVTLMYSSVVLDKSTASLTARNHYSDPPVPVSGWEFVNDKSIRLLPTGTRFQQGTLYEFSYQAKDPLVTGLSFAALRDFADFLRQRAKDDDGTPNPLAGAVQFIYTFSISQPSRFVHDFLLLGFNESEQGKRVFDGIFSYTGGGSGGFFNYRFAQTGSTHRQHINRWFPEIRFPFADQVTFDPIAGKTDGRLRRCLATKTCPKIFEVNSENEYWSKAGSLLHTDTRGKDLDLDADPNVRAYLFSGLPHGAATGPGNCQQPRNPLIPNPGNRALLIALDEWVSQGKQPPPSQLPRRSNGTLAPPLPQESQGFPHIPGVKYNGVIHTGDLFNFGSSFDQGILTKVPPAIEVAAYPAFVPKTDRDGNDIAGIRLPEVAVPLATYTGWALRAGPAAGDGCDAYGQQIAFAKTKAERIARGDPRLSIEERYQTHDGYVSEVVKATRALVKNRFLLEEDAETYTRAAEASSVLR